MKLNRVGVSRLASARCGGHWLPPCLKMLDMMQILEVLVDDRV
jgi:hypothetical protein